MEKSENRFLRRRGYKPRLLYAVGLKLLALTHDALLYHNLPDCVRRTLCFTETFISQNGRQSKLRKSWL